MGTSRAVSLIFDRDEDMQSTGQRHAFLASYKVGFTNAGKIMALEADLYNNAGNTLDLSGSIMDRALLHIDNSYKIPNVRVVGHVCRTNQASNTAFRGFGGPQVGEQLAFPESSWPTFHQLKCYSWCD